MLRRLALKPLASFAFTEAKFARARGQIREYAARQFDFAVEGVVA